MRMKADDDNTSALRSGSLLTSRSHWLFFFSLDELVDWSGLHACAHLPVHVLDLLGEVGSDSSEVKEELAKRSSIHSAEVADELKDGDRGTDEGSDQQTKDEERVEDEVESPAVESVEGSQELLRTAVVLSGKELVLREHEDGRCGSMMLVSRGRRGSRRTAIERGGHHRYAVVRSGHGRLLRNGLIATRVQSRDGCLLAHLRRKFR